jgi:hypothetical protein
LRPAEGEYDGFAGNTFSAVALSSVPMSVVTSCASAVVANRLAASALASAAQKMDKGRIIFFSRVFVDQ